jgi:hypothetical protein
MRASAPPRLSSPSTWRVGIVKQFLRYADKLSFLSFVVKEYTACDRILSRVLGSDPGRVNSSNIESVSGCSVEGRSTKEFKQCDLVQLSFHLISFLSLSTWFSGHLRFGKTGRW